MSNSQPEKVDLHTVIFKGHEFHFKKTKGIDAICKEIFSDNYKVLESKLEFSPGDVILDIGANEGVFSVMMSVFFPAARIIAIEPIPATFQTLMFNKEINNCDNLQAFRYAVGGKGRETTEFIVSKDYSGGSTSKCTFNPEHHYKVDVATLTLDDLFLLLHIDRCKLLKMDIEGMEYDALYASTILPRVDNFVGEFHMNQKLEYEGRRVDGLINWVKNQTRFIHVELCKMAE